MKKKALNFLRQTSQVICESWEWKIEPCLRIIIIIILNFQTFTCICLCKVFRLRLRLLFTYMYKEVFITHCHTCVLAHICVATESVFKLWFQFEIVVWTHIFSCITNLCKYTCSCITNVWSCVVYVISFSQCIYIYTRLTTGALCV